MASCKMIDNGTDKNGIPIRIFRSGRNTYRIQRYDSKEHIWDDDGAEGIFFGEADVKHRFRELLKAPPTPKQEDEAEADEGYHPVVVTMARDCRRCGHVARKGETVYIRRIDSGWLILCEDCYRGPKGIPLVGAERPQLRVGHA